MTGKDIGSSVGAIGGSIIPGVGTVIGSIAGGLIGGIGDMIFGGESEEERRRKRDEEMKKKALLAVQTEQSKYLQYPTGNNEGYLPAPINMVNMG